MNRREINQYNMILSVDEYLSKNESLFNGLPAVNQAVATLHTHTGSIRTLADKQGITTKGQTALKIEERFHLTTVTLRVIDALKAHAAATNDVRLRTIVNQFVPSNIEKMRELELLTAVTQIYNEAAPLQAHLEIWGINADDIKELNTPNVSLSRRTAAIRGTQAVRKQATEELKQTIKQTMNLLKNTIDPMMLPFRTTNPTFYGEYKATRVIIDIAATQRSSANSPTTKSES